MILTDTHTHLYTEHFNTDIDSVIKNCIAKGVKRLFFPNIDSSSIAGMMALAEKYPTTCFPMMGLHPTSVKTNYLEELAVVENWLANYNFCAVGEIGIDLYWDKTLLKEQQDAFNEIFEILDELNDENMRGIFHCFTGNIEQAKHIINYGGFKLGIGGVVTFKNSGLDKVVERLDLDHLVLETDSPYLAPMPYRGKRNESTYLYLIAEKIAEIHHTTIETVAKITTQNSIKVFGF